MEYDNTNRGTLFKNTRQREGKKDPEYAGSINVDGVEYWLDAWLNTAKRDGKKFFGLKVRPKNPDQAPPTKQAAPPPTRQAAPQQAANPEDEARLAAELAAQDPQPTEDDVPF